MWRSDSSCELNDSIITEGRSLYISGGLVADKDEGKLHFGEGTGGKDTDRQMVLGGCVSSDGHHEGTVGSALKGEASEGNCVMINVIVNVVEGYRIGITVIADCQGRIAIIVVDYFCLV